MVGLESLLCVCFHCRCLCLNVFRRVTSRVPSHRVRFLPSMLCLSYMITPPSSLAFPTLSASPLLGYQPRVVFFGLRIITTSYPPPRVFLPSPAFSRRKMHRRYLATLERERSAALADRTLAVHLFAGRKHAHLTSKSTLQEQIKARSSHS